ncbi:MAG: hypothetical protein HY561_02155 [Gemmatimonadetes bacterium]|nr:hypothetical protein [Gemmatimonadota bacterium]
MRSRSSFVAEARASAATARARPALPPGLVLAVAVLGVSWSGPLVRLSDAAASGRAARSTMDAHRRTRYG